MTPFHRSHKRRLLALALTALLAACNTTSPAQLLTEIPQTQSVRTNTQAPASSQAAPTLPAATQTAEATGLDTVIPRPASIEPGEGTFMLTSETRILVDPGTEAALEVGKYLAGKLAPATGYPLPVEAADGSGSGNISLRLSTADPGLGEEGYRLTITPEAVSVAANQPAGLFYGVQTMRQLLPATIDSESIQPGPWALRAGTIRDVPRFAWRGTMLDVARHFFSVRDLTRYIDLLAYYKINRLHLHLSDDQGWRIQINAWPNLTLHGGSLEVGGTPGGYYSQDDYAYIVAYAQSRFITIVPEIDMPGHVTAALASYAELNCNDMAPELFTGIEVGFSTLCISKDITFTFVEDVLRELAALTPGPYLHVGGDEAQATSLNDYIEFTQRVQTIVKDLGKRMIGWEEIAQGRLLDSTILQHWNQGDGFAKQSLQQDVKIIMSPSDRTYIDMKYTSATTLGLDWAGYISVEKAYAWDPATEVGGVTDAHILGVEAPLWSETLQDLEDIEYMAFPRILGIAEIGWSPQNQRNWSEYKTRLALQGPRLEALGVNFYQTPEVPWP
jgi:hexosaminidase